MSVEDVAQVTKISRTAVRAIEEGNFDALPAPVFARGFIRAFADCVSIDGGPLIRRLDRIEREAAQPKGERAVTDTHNAYALPVPRASERFGGMKGGYILLLILAAGMLVAAWLMVGGKQTKRLDVANSPEDRPALQERVDGVSHYTDSKGPGYTFSPR